MKTNVEVFINARKEKNVDTNDNRKKELVGSRLKRRVVKRCDSK